MELTIQIGQREITVGKESVYKLLSVEGIEASDYSVVLSENAQLDGAFVANKKVLPRTIDISFDISDLDNTEAYRQLLISFLTPKKTGILTVSRNHVKRRIEFELQDVEFKQPHLYHILQVNLSLICADPYFRDGSDQIREMMEKIPLFTFPFNSLQNVGVMMGFQRRIDTITIENSGDTSIGIIAEMIAEGGSVTNPQVICNQKFVKVIDVMNVNDEIVINTNQGNKTITKNGKSSFKFDRRSIFFSIPVGTSNVTIIADVNQDNMRSRLIYSLKYLGV